ncbi:hypothetical protein DFA_12139 [Cavenderia fasciculata]|uniref:Uncharacterized protein n=1 Tax=Cavenderia fasciculata TaxID=261658 RepID=F4QC86_CACFS|nr:uncharacterized protein DFA_12139 [Cavenderia fasciculata]EGG14367.1 hypothetical protein DFA_12139 [Cavenderia fasciculata]|eukprot:XP_004351091.1 hypothetical protein DFA_12139 [Cavenderia fasciculata]
MKFKSCFLLLIISTFLLINIVNCEENNGLVTILRKNKENSQIMSVVTNLHSGILINPRGHRVALTPDKLGELKWFVGDIKNRPTRMPSLTNNDYLFEYTVTDEQGKQTKWGDGDEEDFFTLVVIEEFFEEYVNL